VKRKFRLTSATDFKRVRRYGKSHAHPLVVLISLPNDLDVTRFGVAAGRSLGNAVRRNRAKRQIREVIRPLIPSLKPGWDNLLLARSDMAEASFKEIKTAIETVLKRAELFKD
jgi:ribonuclease P protein component